MGGMDSVIHSLTLASRVIGGEDRLAEYLGVAQALLKEWLDGRREPPTSAYVRVLDLVVRDVKRPGSGR